MSPVEGRGLIVMYRARKSEVTRPPLGHSYLPTYRITPPSVISNFSLFSQTHVKISRKCLVQSINRPIADPLGTLLDFSLHFLRRRRVLGSFVRRMDGKHGFRET